jgi:hypothetical protein
MRRLEYRPEGATILWKVDLFDQLAEDYAILDNQMPQFHACATRTPRAWQVLRMLYGINPVIVPSDTDADFLKIWSRSEVSARLKISLNDLETMLDTLLAAWQRVQPETILAPVKPLVAPKPTTASKPPPGPAPPKPRRTAPPPPRNAQETSGSTYLLSLTLPPLEDTQQDLLSKYGFSDKLFCAAGHAEAEAVAERDWFVERISEITQLLDEPAVSSLARSALMNELYERRLDDQMALADVASKEFADLSDAKEQVASEYREQWEQIKGIVPWANKVSHKNMFAGVLSDVLDGYIKYKADPKNKLLDGVFTALEIQVLMRESQQAGIRYRPGQVAAILEAMHNLADPNWERSLPNNICKQMDQAFREAAEKFRETNGMPLPNIESDDPKVGEYPPLYVPKETPLEEPKENIPLS